MTAFADLGLSEAALAAVERMGYADPTPVQEQAIPLVLEGRDVIAAASTGTGKTAAFLLPLLSTLPRVKGRNRPPRVLVVSPTRELASQISRTAMQISRKTGHFVTTVFGGTPYGPQIRELRGGTDVLIATPGRLNDLMDRDVVDLSRIEALVLDEADRMLDMGFLPDVTKIVDATPGSRQTLLFSATIDSSIQKNLSSLLTEPAIVEIARNGETAKTVQQFIMPIQNAKKPELLRAVLEEKGHERVIVFARTKFRCEEFAESLNADGYRAESIHSDKSQGRRRRALDSFRKGKVDILVATDVLARGIDVPDVDYVINLDLPDMAEDYVHRIGRTGRAGEEGFAISFVTRETVRTLREIEKLIDQDIPFMQLETYETDPSVLEKGKKGGKNSQSRGKRTSGSGRTSAARRAEGERVKRGEGSFSRGRDDRDGGRERRGGYGNRDDRRGSKRFERDGERGDRAGRGEREGREWRNDRNERGGRFERGDRGFDRERGTRGDRNHGREGRFDRYDRRDRDGHQGERGGQRGHSRFDDRRDFDEVRRERNAKNAQQRLNRKERRAEAAAKANAKKKNGGKKRGNGGGYDYSKFTKGGNDR